MMRKPFWFVFVLFLFLLNCGGTSGSGLSSGNIKLTGRVADSETGNGLYAKVTISSGALSRETYTSVKRSGDETLQDVGWFVFNDVPNGNIKIQIEVVKEDADESVAVPLIGKVIEVNQDAKDADYYGIWETTLDLYSEGPSVYEITDQNMFSSAKYNYIAMRPGFTAKIQVLASPMAEPVSGAKVFVVNTYYDSEDNNAYSDYVVRSGVTDETGLVTFSKLMKHGQSIGEDPYDPDDPPEVVVNPDYVIVVYPADIDGDGCWDYVSQFWGNSLYGDNDVINRIVQMVPIDDLYGDPSNFTLAKKTYSSAVDFNFVVSERPLYFYSNYPITPRLAEDAVCAKCEDASKTASTLCNTLGDDIALEVESVFAGMGAKVTPASDFEAGSMYKCQTTDTASLLYGTLDTVCPAGYTDVYFETNPISITAVEDSADKFTAKTSAECGQYKKPDGNAYQDGTIPCIVGPITNIYIDGTALTGTAIDTNEDGVLDSLGISCFSKTAGLTYDIASRSLIDNRVLWSGNVVCLDE